MGWASGHQVFDPVARQVIHEFRNAALTRTTARTILATLIEALQARDWDTENESLDQFRDHDYVVAAFRDCDIHDGEEDDDLSVDAYAIARGEDR